VSEVEDNVLVLGQERRDGTVELIGMPGGKFALATDEDDGSLVFNFDGKGLWSGFRHGVTQGRLILAVKIVVDSAAKGAKGRDGSCTDEEESCGFGDAGGLGSDGKGVGGEVLGEGELSGEEGGHCFGAGVKLRATKNEAEEADSAGGKGVEEPDVGGFAELVVDVDGLVVEPEVDAVYREVGEGVGGEGEGVGAALPSDGEVEGVGFGQRSDEEG